MCLQYKSFENAVEKEIAHKYFLLFPQCFYLYIELSAILIKFEIVICKLFQSKISISLQIYWRISFENL